MVSNLQLERRNDKYKFMRIDADVTNTLTEETSEDELKDATETLKEIFTKALNNEKLTIQVQKLKNADTPSIITLSEEGRRMHTSDEAVLILMANPGRAGEIIWLLAVKVVIAVAAGYFVDGVMQKYIVRTEKNVHIKTRETVRPSKMEVVRDGMSARHNLRIKRKLPALNGLKNQNSSTVKADGT